MQVKFDQIKIVLALRMARAAVGWSQEELASQLGMAKTTIARMETLEGNLSATQLAQLVNLYASAGVDLEFMVGDEVRVRVNQQALGNAQARLLDTAFRRSDRVKPVGLINSAMNAPTSSRQLRANAVPLSGQQGGLINSAINLRPVDQTHQKGLLDIDPQLGGLLGPTPDPHQK
jgi:transcriptional regulator with XRE-family HTH domain